MKTTYQITVPHFQNEDLCAFAKANGCSVEEMVLKAIAFTCSDSAETVEMPPDGALVR